MQQAVRQQLLRAVEEEQDQLALRRLERVLDCSASFTLDGQHHQHEEEHLHQDAEQPHQVALARAVALGVRLWLLRLLRRHPLNVTCRTPN